MHDTAYSVKVLDEDGRPGSHFELKHALHNDDIGPFLILTGEDGLLPESFADSAKEVGESQVAISQNRKRHIRFFIVQ